MQASQIVSRVGLAPTRWQRAVSALIKKDPGQPNINRLRIIHLYKADYNLFLKTTWARRLVTPGEDPQPFGQSQHGSCPGRTANDIVLLKRLTYNMSQQTQSNLGTFDNDAKSCYDRIVSSVAMLLACRLGMPAEPIQTHA